MYFLFCNHFTNNVLPATPPVRFVIPWKSVASVSFSYNNFLLTMDNPTTPVVTNTESYTSFITSFSYILSPIYISLYFISLAVSLTDSMEINFMVF